MIWGYPYFWKHLFVPLNFLYHKERVTKNAMENYLKMDLVKYGKLTRATVINCITVPEGSGNKLMFNFKVSKGEKPFKRGKIPDYSDSDLELERENDDSYSTEQTLKLGGTSSGKCSSSSSS